MILVSNVALAFEEITFEECVSQASASNPSLLAARSALLASEAVVSQSYSNFYPQLQASLDYSVGNTLAAGAVGGTFTPVITARQNLFAGKADVARINQAKAVRDARIADVQTAKSELSFALKTAFSNLVQAQELLGVNASIKEHRERSYKLVSLLFESGRENLGSVLLAKANLDQATFLLGRSKDALQSSSIQLASALGRSPTDQLRTKSHLTAGPLPQSPDFEELAQEIPEYLKAQAAQRESEARRELAESGFFPSLDITSSVRKSENSQNINTQRTVGISLSYAMFNGGRDYYGFKNASEGITTAMLNKRSILQRNTSAIANAYFAYKQAFEQLTVDRSFLKALNAQAKIAKENYNNGRLNFQNWDLIETSFIQRQQAVVVSQQSVVTAQAAFERALGKGVIQ